MYFCLGCEELLDRTGVLFIDLLVVVIGGFDGPISLSEFEFAFVAEIPIRYYHKFGLNQNILYQQHTSS